MTDSLSLVMHLLQFTDSAFPVGTFSFSNGLETAAFEGLVHDAPTLEQYTRDMARQAAMTDGVAALKAHACHLRGDFAGITEADRSVILCKMNAEARQMVCRMGKKLAELSIHLIPDQTLSLWLDEIRTGNTPGSYPVAQGLVFAAEGIGSEELFCSHQYGVINMVLSAALRCVRVSHFDTQRILFNLSRETPALYEQVRTMELEEMNTFTPQADILASLHEKGLQRMFMN